VVALAPVADLRRAFELDLSDGAVGLLLEGGPDQYSDRYAATSPIELLPLEVPQVLIHGQEDENVPLELSERYSGAATAVGDDVRLLRLPGTAHFEPADPLAPQWGVVMESVRALIGAPATSGPL
jgi:dipeptidyl aminopeptidase/acylaminoacyl peptidase